MSKLSVGDKIRVYTHNSKKLTKVVGFVTAILPEGTVEFERNNFVDVAYPQQCRKLKKKFKIGDTVTLRQEHINSLLPYMARIGTPLNPLTLDSETALVLFASREWNVP